MSEAQAVTAPSEPTPPGGSPTPPRAPVVGHRVPTWRRVLHQLSPLLWIGPAIGLICFVVLLPVYEMFRTSFRDIDSIGYDHGWAGWLNFKHLFKEPDLSATVLRTVVWVVVVVAVTIVLSLGLAQLFNQRFPGRRVTRWALIAPWAASVVMTSIVFRWMLDPRSGLINVFLHDIGVVHKLGSAQAGWLGRPGAFWWLVGVAVFVSLPFTTYALLAGLQTIPPEVYEAARVDGASTGRTYFSITLPLLRPALTVATLINIMNVFNSFPIIWEMTRGVPSTKTSTTTILMYQLKASSIPESAAMSVINFGFVIVLVLIFLRASRWKQQVG